MSVENSANQTQWQRSVRSTAWLGMLAIAFLFGQICGGPKGAEGEVRKRTEQKQFKSGALLNGPVLREISTTLKRIDTRLQRMEIRWEKSIKAAND